MKQTRLIMGMPVTIEIVDELAGQKHFDEVFGYFRAVDARFSTYKPDSEISQINRGLPRHKWSGQMRRVFELCDLTRRQSNGFFNIAHDGQIDPSGLVKGWAIHNAAQILERHGQQNFYVDAGGDIQLHGQNYEGQPWQVGIRNPFNRYENVKLLALHNNEGVATSGAYIRGDHIYNPLQPDDKLKAVASLTVIGPNIYEADRFATAAYAMGRAGVGFIEHLPGFEGYMIDSDGQATMTAGFEQYVGQPV